MMSKTTLGAYYAVTLLSVWLHVCYSYTECNWDVQCAELHSSTSSVCMDNGRCSNPYTNGCLNSYYSQYTNTIWGDDKVLDKRICNSDDIEGSLACDVSPFGYDEIRIHNGNWESAIFYSWIMQIFLSEFLNVPATVGLGSDSKEASFYSLEGAMSWSAEGYAFEALAKSNELGGHCELTNESCAHVLPEVWIGQEKTWEAYLASGDIDQVSGDGQVGKISWYIPQRTAERYPEFVSYHGMSGRREELAEIFLRPTSWKEYCSEESPNGCEIPDEVAQRAPRPAEEDMYFSEGAFTGFFRDTDENNCTANPDTCTGHIVGASCGWSTNLEAQAYHNNIALASSGSQHENGAYTYGQMIQIWRAANATDSDVVMWWWTPDATVEEFRGTPYQFQPVLLPEPTLECRDARINPEDRCSADINVRRGNALGGCDNEANALQTVIASSLRENSYAASDVDRSPGYLALRDLKVSHLDMNVMLAEWNMGGQTGFAARQAVCSWVVEHQDVLKSFIPVGYPKVYEDDDSYKSTLMTAALACALFACVFTIVVLLLVWCYQSTKVFVYAQVTFINMILAGMFCLALGSITYVIEPADYICISRVWFVTLGYTLALLPLLVKIAAINRLVAATKRLRRVKIDIHSLYLLVAGVVTLVLGFLICWTVLDPPKRAEEVFLKGDTAIVTSLTCTSDSTIWETILLGWNAVLIICATVLAFQSRNLQQEFNESRSLGTMIYSHFVVTLLYGVVWNLGNSNNNSDELSFDPANLAAASSFLLAFDVVSAITIYIVPKLFAAHAGDLVYTESSTDNSRWTSFYGPGSDRASIGVRPSVQSMSAQQNAKQVRMQSLPSINEEFDEQESVSSKSGATPGHTPASRSRAESGLDDGHNGGPRFARTNAIGTIDDSRSRTARDNGDNRLGGDTGSDSSTRSSDNY